MIYLLLTTVPVNKTRSAVVHISLIGEKEDGFNQREFFIRPTVSLKSKLLQSYGINKSQLLQAAPFCDVANELIEVIGSETVCFLSNFEYRMFVSEFKTIGYNCSLNYKTLDFVLKSLQIPSREADIGSLYKMSFFEEEVDYAQHTRGELLRMLYHHFSKAIVKQGKDLTDRNRLDSLRITSPLLQKPGVYYLKNEKDKVIYVGKAKKVRNRLQAHFSNVESNKKTMYSEVASIDIEYTGSDLIAQLLESHEIKNFTPKFNAQQVKTPDPFQIGIKTNKRGIKRFVIERKDYQDSESDRFYNRNSAKKRLEKVCNEYNLCPKFCSLERTAGSCSKYFTEECLGVCIGKEAVAVYNARVQQALNSLREEVEHKIIKVAGRKQNEVGFVLISNGVYQGFGFYNTSDSITNLNDLEAYLQRYENNYDTNRIVDTLIAKISKENIIELESGT